MERTDSVLDLHAKIASVELLILRLAGGQRTAENSDCEHAGGFYKCGHEPLSQNDSRPFAAGRANHITFVGECVLRDNKFDD